MTDQKRLEPGERHVVGLMSGTSADGIDAVVAALAGSGTGLRARLVAHRLVRFPAAFRTRLLQLSLTGTVAEVCEMNFALGAQFARAALAVIRQAGLTPADIALIGSHGQTVHHLPRARTPSTLQIGEPAVIAERTGITTVANFRVRDMAAGGQGAPLVPYVDWALFTHARIPRLLQNVGGIGNVTLLPAGGRLDQIRAFDTGPGNAVIDAVVRALSEGRKTYDRGGAWAARGQPDADLLQALLAHPYFARRPPKTTGREDFGPAFVADLLAAAARRGLPPADIVATATALTAASIADAYRRFVFPKLPAPDRRRLQVVLSGGGMRNLTLRKLLAARLPECQITTLEKLGFASQAKEALAFAILGHETLQGQPSNVPGATGARRPVVLGCVVPGRGGFTGLNRPDTAPGTVAAAAR